MCGITITFSWCRAHKMCYEVMREDDPICEEASQKSPPVMGDCSFGIVEYHAYEADIICPSCSIRGARNEHYEPR